MLDTLKLSLTDFDIRPDADLEVQDGTFNYHTKKWAGVFPLWADVEGFVTGRKAFYNEDPIYVTVQPVTPNEPMTIGCYVQFSVPKVANGSNYEPADFETTKTALKTIHSELKRIGIKTNLKTATLSRLDSCKTVVAREPFEAYHPVLNSLRATHSSIKKRDYGTTFLWHNKQQQICVYDKIAEMKAGNHQVSKLPSNSIRFEHRMLNARKIRDSIGLSNVKDLLTNYDQVKAGYEAAMRKQLFNYSHGEVEVMTARSIAEQLQHFKDTGSRYYLQDYLVALGIAQMAGSMDALLAAVEIVSPNRDTRHRMRKQLNNAQHQALQLRESPHTRRTLKDLYHELEASVLSA